MARTRVGNKGSSQRRIKQREEDSDESDEEYKVTDEDFDESDECYSLDGDESEEISADFGKSKRVSRSRKTRKTSGKKVNGIIEPRKRRRVCYTEEDDEEDNDDEDDADFMSWDREANQANKTVEKKRISYSEVDDDDGGGGDDDYDAGGGDDDGGGGDDNNDADDREEEDYKDFVFSVKNRKQRTKPREKKRVVYTENEDGDGDGDGDDDEKEVADEDDAEFMSWDREANQVNKPMERKWDSFTEVDDDDDDDDDDGDGGGDDYKEFVSSGRSRKQRRKPQEKKRVVYTEDDDEGDDDEEKEVANEDDAEFTSFGRKTNQIKTPTAMRRDSYPEKDDDDDDDDEEEEVEEVGEKEEDDDDDEEDDEDYYAEFVSSGRKKNQRKKPRENKVDYTEDDEDGDEDEDEDDTEFVPSGRKRNQRKKPQEKKVEYTEDEEDDAEFVSSRRRRNQRKKPQEKKVDYTEDDEDDAEFVSSRRRRNQRKKPQEKKVEYTEDEEDGDEDNADDEDDADDDEYMYSGREVNHKKNLWGKSEVSYEEEEEENDDDEDNDDDDDSGFNKRPEKRIVSYKEDDEEEDENDAEFKLSESDFVDDEDEIPKIKKNKAMRSHPQKKSVRRGRKKIKKSKTKNTTKPKQRNHKSGHKLGSSNEKSTTNKTKTENRSKISKKRKHRADWQRAMAESDSDFVNSASSDHEYTISEEEREQMREAKVYCANFRANLRSSSCGNQEKQPTLEQKKYPMRKGKEKIEDIKDDIGKQVCGICLSEEQKRTMRGVLNCCRHYFCFACIMEWSKVESRCPLCKQRFTTITKAAKSDTGFDLRTVVIPVPECDQVYEPSEEELRGYLDPYENVICTECQNGGDDALMLLCDICDSSAHTFCVGLGQEVPEGNWYCEGCRPTVFGTQNSDRRLSNNASDLSSPSPIPGGFDLNELYVPETPMTQQTRVVPEPNPASTGTVATTLRERRRLHRQRHHQLLNNNRMNELVGRPSGPSASSSGIRLFGSQLDQARVSVSQNDHIFSSMHEPSNFYSRTDQFPVQVHNSSLSSADVAFPEFTTGICTDPPVH